MAAVILHMIKDGKIAGHAVLIAGPPRYFTKMARKLGKDEHALTIPYLQYRKKLLLWK